MIVTLAVRVLQLIFAAIVLALSVVLINGFGPGHGPSLFDYGAFVGGAGLVFAAIGIVAIFLEPIQGVILLILDGLATLFTLAGGIAYAAKLHVGSCTDTSLNGYLANHGGIFVPSANKVYDVKPSDFDDAVLDDIEGRCKEAQATAAFVWFLFATFAVALVLSFMAGKGKGRSSIV